jgi:hypothetical protein
MLFKTGNHVTRIDGVLKGKKALVIDTRVSMKSINSCDFTKIQFVDDAIKNKNLFYVYPNEALELIN